MERSFEAVCLGRVCVLRWGGGERGPIVEFSVISPFKGCVLASVMHAAIIPGSFCAMLSVPSTICFYNSRGSRKLRNRILILLS